MITAKQFLKKHAPCSTEGFMIEFAKLHVEAALKAASENVEFDEEALIRQSILQSYPLDKIK